MQIRNKILLTHKAEFEMLMHELCAEGTLKQASKQALYCEIGV